MSPSSSFFFLRLTSQMPSYMQVLMVFHVHQHNSPSIEDHIWNQGDEANNSSSGNTNRGKAVWLQETFNLFLIFLFSQLFSTLSWGVLHYFGNDCVVQEFSLKFCLIIVCMSGFWSRNGGKFFFAMIFSSFWSVCTNQLLFESVLLAWYHTYLAAFMNSHNIFSMSTYSCSLLWGKMQGSRTYTSDIVPALDNQMHLSI